MLNLHDAIQVYMYLAKCLPNDIGEDIYFLSDTIIKSVIEMNDAEDYFCALEILLGKKREEIITMGHERALVEFIKSLAENHFIELVAFCRGIGYAS